MLLTHRPRPRAKGQIMPVPDDLTELERSVHEKLTAARKRASEAEGEAVAVLYTAGVHINRIAALVRMAKKQVYARLDEAGVPRRYHSKNSPMNGDAQGKPATGGVVSPGQAHELSRRIGASVP